MVKFGDLNHQKQADSGGDLFDGDMLGMECGYELDIQTWSIPYPNDHFTGENGRLTNDWMLRYPILGEMQPPDSVPLHPVVVWIESRQSGKLRFGQSRQNRHCSGDISGILGNMGPCKKYTQLPSGKLTLLWEITIFHGKIHYKWPFSIALLVYQRVNVRLLVRSQWWLFWVHWFCWLCETLGLQNWSVNRASQWRPDWRPSTQVAEFEDMHLYRPKWFEIRTDRRHQKTSEDYDSMIFNDVNGMVNRSFLHAKIHGFSAWFFVYRSVGFAPGWYAKNFAWVTDPGCQGPRGFPLGKVMIDHDAKW